MSDNGDLLKISQLIENNIKYENLKLELNEKVQFLEALIETIPNPIFYKDSNLIYRYCNNAFLEFLGLKREEIIGHSTYDINPKDLADVYTKSDAELLKNKNNQIYECQVMYRDETKHDVIFNKAVVVNKNGNSIGIVGVILDITERKQDEIIIHRLLKIKEAMLEISHSIMEVDNIVRLFELILEKVMKSMESSYAGLVVILDSNGNLNSIVWKSPYEKIKRKLSFKLKETSLWEKLSGNISKPIILNDLNTIENDKVFNQINSIFDNKIKSGIYSPIIIEEKLYGIIAIYSQNNNAFDNIDLKIMEYMKAQVEIAIDNHTMYEKIIYLSRYDKLTDLYNRAYFEELFHKHLREGTKSKKEFFLVIFDLNDLKPVNDIYGHFIGDELIKMFAKNIKNVVGTNDILGRIGGDEFSAICFEKDQETLIKKLESLNCYFKINQLCIKNEKIVCSFSYGMAKFPSEGCDYSALMSLADKRMYNYKRNFRNN